MNLTVESGDVKELEFRGTSPCIPYISKFKVSVLHPIPQPEYYCNKSSIIVL